MKQKMFIRITLLFALASVAFTFAACGKTNFLSTQDKTLQVEPVDPNNPDSGDEPIGGTLPPIISPFDPGDSGDLDLPMYADGIHPIFMASIGNIIPQVTINSLPSDMTGQNVSTDYDGDGIPNDKEIITNPYVADYPRIVTRISAPVTMEIRVSTTSMSENYSETLNESDFQDTINNAMENKQYTQANKKTTPYVTKDSYSEGGKNAQSFGHSQSKSSKDRVSVDSESQFCEFVKIGLKVETDIERANSTSDNKSFEDEFSRSKSAEKTVFQDVDYVDNLDRNGIEFKNETTQKVRKNARTSDKLKNTDQIGPNDGFVRTSLYLKNASIDMPVKVSNVVCTLSFRTPTGQCLPVKTFRLRNDDYTMFSEEVYGGDELGPYTIEVSDLNTKEVMNALNRGYVPQVHVVSYTMNRVHDSNFNPGFDNLKIVEETAKSRTAVIKIVGPNTRELYRVAAFDVDEYGNISPGISLKKALFNIYADRIGGVESWETDRLKQPLTVSDSNLKWKTGARDKTQYQYSSENKNGNSWRKFETFMKSYSDDNNETKHIESIKRIDALQKFVPFSKEDNPNYNPNEPLSRNDVLKTKFWIIMHNGRYFEGDLNDPIWAGERYEIVLMDTYDFNEHMQTYSYSPFISNDRFLLDTRWNALTEKEGDFARAFYLGKVFPEEVIQLEINLAESRFLFDENMTKNGFGAGFPISGGNRYCNFNYSFQPPDVVPDGIPTNFTYTTAGLTNSLQVVINRSENASQYSIEFFPKDDPTRSRTIIVPVSELEKKDWTITISSKTLNENGEPIGYIDGDSGQGKEYKVIVRAIGTCYGRTITTKGGGTSNIAYITNASDAPRGFIYGATGQQNMIEVRIGNSPNAEYYTIELTGPYNYTPKETPVPVTAVIGYAGYNGISLPSPSIEALKDNNFKPGLYSIRVFAHSNVRPTQGADPVDKWREAANEETHALVQYDQYEKQRRFAPKVSSTLFDLHAIDLQVNFNDGTGWYNLVPYDDPGLFGGDKNIICYGSSHMNQQNQKFYINFKAPYGEYGLGSVFEGNRNESDVYIRTKPREEYRDTFWMLPNYDQEGKVAELKEMPADGRFLNIYTGLENPVEYWLFGYNFAPFLQDTDASNFEKTVASYFEKNRVSTGSTDDYFFSPMEQRLYVIKANTTPSGEYTIIEKYPPFQPGFNISNIEAGVNKVDITDISSRHATDFDVCLTKGAVPKTEWKNYNTWACSPQSASVTTKTYSDLDFSQSYTVCVAGRNQFGLSDPYCNLFSTSAAVASPVDMMTVQVFNGEILVTDLRAENAVGYTALWKWSTESGDNPGIATRPNAPWRVAQGENASIRIPIPADRWGKVIVWVFPYNADRVYNNTTIDGKTGFTRDVQADYNEAFAVNWEESPKVFQKPVIEESTGARWCWHKDRKCRVANGVYGYNDYMANIKITPNFPKNAKTYTYNYSIYSEKGVYTLTDFVSYGINPVVSGGIDQKKNVISAKEIVINNVSSSIGKWNLDLGSYYIGIGVRNTELSFAENCYSIQPNDHDPDRSIIYRYFDTLYLQYRGFDGGGAGSTAHPYQKGRAYLMSNVRITIDVVFYDEFDVPLPVTISKDLPNLDVPLEVKTP